MKRLFKMLEKNDKALSLARVCSLLCFCLFFAVTAFLAFGGKSWEHYHTLAWITGALLFVALLNKSVEIVGGLKVFSEKKEDDKQ